MKIQSTCYLISYIYYDRNDGWCKGIMSVHKNKSKFEKSIFGYLDILSRG